MKFSAHPTAQTANPLPILVGVDPIADAVSANVQTVAMDGMWGVDWNPLVVALSRSLARRGTAPVVLWTKDFLRDPTALRDQFQPFLTDNPTFGRVCTLPMSVYFDHERLAAAIAQPRGGAPLLLVGPFALGLCQAEVGLYCDLPRELIIRRQAEGLPNLGEDLKRSTGDRYKHAYYIEWPMQEAHKRTLLRNPQSRVDWYLDGSDAERPVAVTHRTLVEAVKDLTSRPFRCKPFFMPGVWGGQRLKEVADLPRLWPNCAWDFELVAPENAVTVDLGGAEMNLPFSLLMWLRAQALVGDQVWRQFGEYFPVRVNYLDTMSGSNLSLQVYPHQSYMCEHFGEPMGQDESYYIVERKPGAKVYLGLRTETTQSEFQVAVRRAEQEQLPLEATDYVNAWDANPGDLFLIPAGTVHCSGADNLVLEISATPYWYTFKLYDYLRLDLDGRPRPINSAHGFAVLDATRTTEEIKRSLIPEPVLLRSEPGGEEYQIGSHAQTFYMINRLHLTAEMTDHTEGGFLLMTVVAGQGVRIAGVDSPERKTEIAYLETYLVPACFGAFRIEACGGPCQHLVRLTMQPVPAWCAGWPSTMQSTV